jgi:hypothetical protein
VSKDKFLTLPLGSIFQYVDEHVVEVFIDIFKITAVQAANERNVLDLFEGEPPVSSFERTTASVLQVHLYLSDHISVDMQNRASPANAK